jgi:XTP/dITP diphosphohydrolase
MDICFATNNHHKLEEVMAVLGKDFRLLTLAQIGCDAELPETQATIAGNATQKAKYVWDHFHFPCFADDSGLEVDALGGRPGVDSAHYAGAHRNSDDNINMVLAELEGIERRGAQFRSVISLFLPGGEWSFEGILRGSILTHRNGHGGFGYDPVFLPDGSDKTLAEMTMDEKNAISHRGIAVRKLAAFLKSYR